MTEKLPGLSESQVQAVQKIGNLLREGRRSITLGGLAGTGKTTVIGQLDKELGYAHHELAYCAFTGKAATVITQKLPATQATTIHRLIYSPADTHDEQCPRKKDPQAACDWLEDCGVVYRPKPSLPDGIRLVVVDEASMVPEWIHDQLLSYGVPVLWVGDHGQLGPVKSSFNLMAEPELLLTKIHRQAAESAIIRAAMTVRRELRPLRAGRYNSGELIVRHGFKVPGFDPQEFYDGELVYLVPTNAMRVAMNKGIRAELDIDSHTPVVGDRVVCLRNNDRAGVYNGLTGVITWMGDRQKERGRDLVRLEVKIDNEDRQYVGYAHVPQFHSQFTLAQEVHRDDADLWDYGYALTVHKAQGSEYRRVIVMANLSRVPQEKQRWLYTAITRAKEQLEIVYPPSLV